MSITYSGCVSVAVSLRHSIRMSHIVICGLSGSTRGADNSLALPPRRLMIKFTNKSWKTAGFRLNR
jgi:hypothetical protein